MAYAVGGNHRYAVGHGVAALHGGPGFELPRLFVGGVIVLPADSGGVDEQFGTLQRHQTGGFGVPLIPAYKHAEAPYGCVDGVDAEVAGGEVEFLIETGVVGDVGLAVATRFRAVSVLYYGGIVIQPGGAALKHRGDNHHTQLAGQSGV